MITLHLYIFFNVDCDYAPSRAGWGGLLHICFMNPPSSPDFSASTCERLCPAGCAVQSGRAEMCLMGMPATPAANFPPHTARYPKRGLLGGPGPPSRCRRRPRGKARRTPHQFHSPRPSSRLYTSSPLSVFVTLQILAIGIYIYIYIHSSWPIRSSARKKVQYRLRTPPKPHFSNRPIADTN